MAFIVHNTDQKLNKEAQAILMLQFCFDLLSKGLINQ